MKVKKLFGNFQKKYFKIKRIVFLLAGAAGYLTFIVIYFLVRRVPGGSIAASRSRGLQILKAEEV
jgi:hypothetical protein